MGMIKCPYCHCPLEKKFENHQMIRYRCTICGKQTNELKEVPDSPQGTTVSESESAG